MPLSVIVAGMDAAMQWCHFALDAPEHKLWAGFMPGPLTLVLPLHRPLPFLPNDAGFRQPDHPLTQAVADRFDQPFTATSANLSGQPPAYSVEEFLSQIADSAPRPDLIVDGGKIQP